MKCGCFLAALMAFGISTIAVCGGGAGVSPVHPQRDVQDFVYLGEQGPVLLRFHVRIDGKPLVDVWEQFMAKLFAYLDRDGDGALSREEAGVAPPIVVLFGYFPGAVAQQANVAEAMDKDRDGKITREEMADWYRQNGAGPFQFHPKKPQSQRTVRSTGRPQPLPADALNEKLYALLDADKDKKLSRKELAKAPAVLGKLDFNDDEMIDVAEMNGDIDKDGFNMGMNIDNVDFGGAEVVSKTQQSDIRDPFVMVDPVLKGKQLARELLNRYAPKSKRSSVRKLTRQDLGMDETAFARLDVDEDGKLDRVELAYFVRRSPDLEFHVRLGTKNKGELGVELIQNESHLSQLAKSIRSLSAGTLHLKFGTVRIELGNDDGSRPARSNPRRRFLNQFAAANKDKNDYLDDKEAKQSPLFRGFFRMMDRDGDGKLFKKELVAYLDEMLELQKSATNSCASLAVQDQGRGLFDAVDANKDGRLSVREMRRMVDLVSSLDRDSDGRLSLNEIPHRYRVDVQRKPDFSIARNRVTPVRMGMDFSSMPQRNDGPRWFRKMDRNRDGDVSRREFLGTDAEFCRIDSDGDKLISSAEAKRADEMFRKKK